MLDLSMYIKVHSNESQGSRVTASQTAKKTGCTIVEVKKQTSIRLVNSSNPIQVLILSPAEIFFYTNFTFAYTIWQRKCFCFTCKGGDGCNELETISQQGLFFHTGFVIGEKLRSGVPYVLTASRLSHNSIRGGRAGGGTGGRQIGFFCILCSLENGESIRTRIISH